MQQAQKRAAKASEPSRYNMVQKHMLSLLRGKQDLLWHMSLSNSVQARIVLGTTGRSFTDCQRGEVAKIAKSIETKYPSRFAITTKQVGPKRIALYIPLA